jgi:hypothetical protein
MGVNVEELLTSLRDGLSANPLLNCCIIRIYPCLYVVGKRLEVIWNQSDYGFAEDVSLRAVLEHHHDALAKFGVQTALFHWSKEVMERFVTRSAAAVGKGKSLLGTPSIAGFLNVGGLDVSKVRSKVWRTVIVGKPSKEMELSKLPSIALIAGPKRESICLAECLEGRVELVSVVHECFKGAREVRTKFREHLHCKM